MSDIETRELILRTVQEMLQEGMAEGEVTVRRIAERANIGVGTINYHYHSKDKLISDAVSGLINAMATDLMTQNALEGDPHLRLKQFLMITADLSIQNYEMSRIQVAYDMDQGDLSICYYIIPILKEIFHGSKAETEIKLIAVVLIATMQSLLLKKDAFFRYSGFDLQSKAQREEAIDLLLKNIIVKEVF
jgi:AcrR family transcriptional regulator